MTKVFIDTDILIDYSKGYSQLLENLLEKQNQKQLELWVNPIIITEFFTDSNLRNKEKLEKAKDFFGFFRVIEINKKIGLLAGEFLREEKVNFIGDALTAATCILEKMRLATGNKKHFSKISGLIFF